MSNFFNLTLDTTGPSTPSISIAGGATYSTAQLVTATIGTGDGTTTGYQMKIWGDVDNTYNASINTTEGTSTWISYNTSQQVKLSSVDGVKTLYVKIRDDVYNESAQASDTIQLNTTLPTVTITGPDTTKISKITGKSVSSFSFSSDQVFTDYEIKVVSASGSAENTGTIIGTANGSTNMSGTGSFASNTAINCTINGADLELASSGDGTKIIKVFVKNEAGQWSA